MRLRATCVSGLGPRIWSGVCKRFGGYESGPPQAIVPTRDNGDLFLQYRYYRVRVHLRVIYVYIYISKKKYIYICIDTGFRVKASEFGVQGLGLRVCGLTV